jgi:PHD/YefM family antitoxin component YafN of YafNO toxin-antitoxin module
MVTKRGVPTAVLIDFEKLETLENLARLWQDPESLRAMKESLEDAKKGRMLRMKGAPTVDTILKAARTKGFLRG